MKYSLPKVNMSLLRRAEEYFTSGLNEFKQRMLKKDTGIIETVFAILNNFFSTIGNISLTRKLLLKEEPPRTSPLSSHYNSFIRCLRSDLTTSFDDHNEIEKAATYHYNYAQANRNMLDGLMKEVYQTLTDFSIISQTSQSIDTWYKDSFNTADKVDSKYEGYTLTPGVVDIREGVFKLPFSESEDIITTDSVNYIGDATVRDPGFVYSDIYYGREFGIVSEGATDEAPRPDTTDKESLTWHDMTISNIVDKDEVDTWWEVEVTAREDMSGKDFDRTDDGPYFFLKDAGETDSVAIFNKNSKIYKYRNGYMCYAYNSYEHSFFYDSDGTPVKRLLVSAIELELKEARTINSISIRRKADTSKTIGGNENSIKVSSIQIMEDGSDEWVSVPGFDKVTSYRTDISTVKNTSRVTNNRLYRTASSGGTIGTVASGNEPSLSTLVPSDSNMSDASRWNFSPVKARRIKIVMYTDEPHKIRYSMARRKILVKSITGTDVHWCFIQYAADRYVKGESGKTGIGNIIGTILLGVIGWLVTFTKTTLEDTIHAVHTLTNRTNSDMYRWSIALSDISATYSIFEEAGELVSIPYLSPYPIDRIILHANHQANGGRIEYYILPDGGIPVRIQPWEEPDDRFTDGRYIPKIIYINSDLPDDRRDKTRYGTHAYIDVGGNVNKFRLVARLYRGDNVETTPVIEDYKIRAIPKLPGDTIKRLE